jgi:hypothetical protein
MAGGTFWLSATIVAMPPMHCSVWQFMTVFM